MMAEQTPMADSNVPPLLSQITFHIIEGGSLSVAEARKIKLCLEEHGAEEHSSPSCHGQISFEGLTHIVAATSDFEGYEAASDCMIPVVKPSWVEASIEKNRVANPRSHSPDPRLFFSGLVVCTADLPEGDKDAIIGGVLAMGGLYSGSVSRQVTHIVALDLEPEACKVALAKKLTCKIVLPHWFDDCLRLGQRIDESPYLLPNPEVLHAHELNRPSGVSRPDLQTSIPAPNRALPSPQSSPGGEKSVFAGRMVMLSTDLDISHHLRSTIEGIIRNGGGEVVIKISEAETLICQFREGQDFRTAGSQGKTIGNLPWLYHLMIHNAWTAPTRRLLHYPVARDGLPGFRNYRISLSNYYGEARIYLENLARAAGCEFTKTMKMDNTHLITAHAVSEKCDAAREWNIHMVNHLWLEESYAKWQIQSVANAKYTHFPPRTNLSEVVGQTHVDRKALEDYFFPKRSKSTPKRDGKAAKVAQITLEREYVVDKAGMTEPAPIQEPSKEFALIHRPRDTESTTPKLQRKGWKSAIQGEAETPITRTLDSRDKENETPSTGSRSAKVKAVANMQSYASDLALYEKEKKRVGGVTHGGKRPSEDLVAGNSMKRPAPTYEEEPEPTTEERNAKRIKKSQAAPSMEILVTGYFKWSQNTKLFQKDKDKLREIGISVTDEYANCKFVAAPKIMRTKKFVCAMAGGPTLLSINFVEQCLAQRKLLDPNDFPLRDDEGELRYRMKLPQAIQRARTNSGDLLRGRTIYVTEDVHGGFDTYRAIVEVNGGECRLFRGRTNINILGDDKRDEDSIEGRIYLVSGTSASEGKLWPKFRSMVEQCGKEPRIVKTDWILDLALSQELRYDSQYSLTEENIGE